MVTTKLKEAKTEFVKKNNDNEPSTKIINIFFPMKPLLGKFSNSFTATQIIKLVDRMKEVTNKVTAYVIESEQIYTYDIEKQKFSSDIMNIKNKTFILNVSVDKSLNLDLSEILDPEFASCINVIRSHRKKHPIENDKFAYIFYTINSTHLLNSILANENKNVNSNETEQNKTYFILSANNMKRGEKGDKHKHVESNFVTEKICKMEYLFTIFYDKISDNDELSATIKKKVGGSLNFITKE